MQDRVKTFQNIRNFRDFGGYDAAEGKRVRTGVLFRSAQFGEASETDLQHLSTYNIKVQADLRRPDERERHGHRWPVKGVKILSSDKGRAKEAPHVRFLSEVAVNADDAHGWMVDYYREAPFKAQHVETFSAWFSALLSLEQDEAAVVNCAAGKDRTGILCALTHHVLGVRRADIFSDYLLTNEAARVQERLPEMARQFNAYIGKAHEDAVYHPFVGVDAVFLQAALAAIEDQHDGLDAYLNTKLGVGQSEITALQHKLLV